MAKPLNILIFGASYGSLLATKLALAGHNTTLVCLPSEAELINAEGTIVRMPVKGQEKLVEIASRTLPGHVSATTTGEADPSKYDLVALAMQEPQYRVPAVRDLLEKVGRAKLPAMSIMNMPPLTFLRRMPGLDTEKLRDCYADSTVWDLLDPCLVTLCSPDPQAFRPPEEKVNVLQVTLPTNFKAARFEKDEHTALLRRLQDDIEAVRFEGAELPVKLKVHDSIFVPTAKWAMLLTGNYRCIQRSGPRAIVEAVHSDIEQSRAVYDWVKDVCLKLGAAPEDLVPFEKYASAAKGLLKPSSAARALFGGAPYIERVDRLVQKIAAQFGMSNPIVEETVAVVDAQLELNRQKAA